MKKIELGVLALFLCGFFTFNFVVNTGTNSSANLKTLSLLTFAGSGGQLCDKFSNGYSSEYGGCYFYDHTEWCQGSESVACSTESYQYRMCPPGSWELVCYEAGIKDCNS